MRIAAAAVALVGDLPVIGVEQPGRLAPAAFDKLCGARRDVDSDYNESATADALRRKLGSAARPA